MMSPTDQGPSVLRRVCASAIALLLSAAPAAARVDALMLGDFVLANLASVAEGPRSVAMSKQWCLAASTDRWTKAWLFDDPVNRSTMTLHARDAFETPFIYHTDVSVGADTPRAGTIVIGYETDPLALGDADDGRRLVASGPDPCSLGPVIVAMSPLTIIEIGQAGQLAEVTQIDPAPQDHWWHVLRHTLRVHLVQRIPVTYLANGRMVPGHIIIAFSHRMSVIGQPD